MGPRPPMGNRGSAPVNPCSVHALFVNMHGQHVDGNILKSTIVLFKILSDYLQNYRINYLHALDPVPKDSEVKKIKMSFQVKTPGTKFRACN